MTEPPKTRDDAPGLDLLAFGPHPDDVELFCGGLLAQMATRGHRTGIVDLTRGERSTRGTVEQRNEETAAAAKELGVCHRENLDLPDGELEATDHATAGTHDDRIARAWRSPPGRVVEALRRLRPEVVVVPWERERHPDHEAASALITRALFLAGLSKWPETEDSPARADNDAPWRPRHVLYYPMRALTTPSFIVDVTAAYARKTAAVACYQSQVGDLRPGEVPEAGKALVASALSLPSLDARDRFYGAHIGVAYGEPYVVRETLGLVDPIEHFRRNTFAAPLFFPERP